MFLLKHLVQFLAGVGRHSSQVLLGGLVLAAALPFVSEIMRPALPFLVVLVIGLAMARLDLRSVFVDFISLRKVWPLLAMVCLLMPITCLILVELWRFAGFAESHVLLLIVFAAAPPLSSAASLSLLLGYNARVTMQVTLLATLATPFIGPLCFILAGIDAGMDILPIALKIAAMNAGGLALGFAIKYMLGTSIIAEQKDAFNGFTMIAMVVFLFPLFDGVAVHVIQYPAQAFGILGLAVALNIGSNVTTNWISGKFFSEETAHAIGLMFGNRNVSFYLAVLPFNPLLSVFIAVYQLPICATPALFTRLYHKKKSLD